MKGNSMAPETTNLKEIKALPNFESYLQPANSNKVRCVDERKAPTEENGVQMPGGVYGIIDAIKTLTGCSEEEAWKQIKETKIPIEGHIDEHHGARGCGYAKLVEDEPGTVLAKESIPANQRLTHIKETQGTVLTLLGDHTPTHATINRISETTMGSNKALDDRLGIFNFDYWAAEKFGEQLGIENFANHLNNVYEATVTKLTGITKFHTLE